MTRSTVARSSAAAEKNMSAGPSVNTGSAMFSPPSVLNARAYLTVGGSASRALATGCPIWLVASMTSLASSASAIEATVAEVPLAALSSAGWREPNVIRWPEPASARPRIPPMNPVPTIAMSTARLCRAFSGCFGRRRRVRQPLGLVGGGHRFGFPVERFSLLVEDLRAGPLRPFLLAPNARFPALIRGTRLGGRGLLRARRLCRRLLGDGLLGLLRVAFGRAAELLGTLEVGRESTVGCLGLRRGALAKLCGAL